nr:MAG TPA: hypothetical protein [Caudoviricetes sp.]
MLAFRRRKHGTLIWWADTLNPILFVGGQR